VVDLSSDEEDIFPDTSRDEDFARRLFNDLNRGLLGPLDDGCIIIIISDFDEEEEMHEDDAIDADAVPPSAVRSPPQPPPSPTPMIRDAKL
jgi:hypothetical protein